MESIDTNAQADAKESKVQNKIDAFYKTIADGKEDISEIESSV